MKKIAIVVAASIYNQKGLLNAVTQRIKHLKTKANYDIDSFVISVYKPWYIRLLTKEKALPKPEYAEIDGVRYRVIWLRNTLFDFVCLHKLKIGTPFRMLQFKKFIKLFEKYDLVEGHSCGVYVKAIHQKYGKPYLISWHGTDTHTVPFQSKAFMKSAREIMESAAHNFFVSKELMAISDGITKNAIKSVLYNGRDERFFKYDKEEKHTLREKYNVGSKKIVAFVGNLLPVKGADLLPSLFRIIYDNNPSTLFWIVGDGPLRKDINDNSKGLPTVLWGNVDYKKMPELMNIIDLLVVPSRNEGLSLVSIEAISCGAKVVASRVGGIPEVVGIDNTIPIENPDFISLFADKCVSILEETSPQFLQSNFEWETSAKKENEIICSIL